MGVPAVSRYPGSRGWNALSRNYGATHGIPRSEWYRTPLDVLLAWSQTLSDDELRQMRNVGNATLAAIRAAAPVPPVERRWYGA
jgi:hypothetical protein